MGQRLTPGQNKVVARLGIARRIHCAYRSRERRVAHQAAELLRLIKARPENLPVLPGATP